MTKTLLPLIGELARRCRVDLAPDWDAAARHLDGEISLADAAEALGWPRPLEIGSPRAEDFPLLAIDGLGQWSIAEQWEAAGIVRMVGNGAPESWNIEERPVTFYRLTFPVRAAGNSAGKALTIFIQAMRRRKRMIVDASVATIVLNVITLGTSLYTMQVYDRVVPRAGFSTLWVLTLGVIIATLLDFVLRNVRAIMLERESAEIDAEISEFFFARSQAVRLDARHGGVGTMAAQLRAYDQVRSLISSATIFAVADLPFAFFFVFVIYLLAGPVALVPLVSFLIALGMALIVARMIRRQTERAHVGANRKNGLMVESLDAAETIKSTRGSWHMLARWNRLVADVERDELDLKRISAIAQSAGAMLQQIAYVALIAWGALEIIAGHMTTGALIAASIISGRINGPLVLQLPGLIVQSSYARSALKGLDDLLKLPVDREPDGNYLRPATIENSVKVDNVIFAYPGARAGIAVPKLQIAPGEKIGIIGPVGSGKTTLLKLMAGLYPPQQGSILLGGLDMNQIAEDQLRSHIGYLGQEYRLIEGTLRDQLTLGLTDPGDQAILKAAEATGLNQLIAAHPQGLELRISEGGRGLSGGQRAMAGLTRLLLARPNMLLLDEPTAAMDQEAEERVLRGIMGSLQPDNTLIFVTHKIQLLNLVQRVMVVVNGQVIMDGPTGAVLEQLRGGAQNQKALS